MYPMKEKIKEERLPKKSSKVKEYLRNVVQNKMCDLL